MSAYPSEVGRDADRLAGLRLGGRGLGRTLGLRRLRPAPWPVMLAYAAAIASAAWLAAAMIGAAR